MRYEVTTNDEITYLENVFGLETLVRFDDESKPTRMFIFIENNNYESYCLGDCIECGKFECRLREDEYVSVKQLMRETKLERICNL